MGGLSGTLTSLTQLHVPEYEQPCEVTLGRPRRPTEVIAALKVDGTANPADALTKYLSKPIFRMYAARMYNCLLEEV